MHVPVDLCALVEAVVEPWHQPSGEDWGDDEIDGLVDNEGANNLVDMLGEGNKAGFSCEGLGPGLQRPEQRGAWLDEEIHGQRSRV